MRRRARRAGVAVAPGWDDFWAFVADMGARPAGTVLRLASPVGGYAPGNCFWGEPPAVEVRLAGVGLPRWKWARLLGVPPRLLRDRMRGGMGGEEALTRPRRRHWRSRDQSVWRVRSRVPGGGRFVSRAWGTFEEALREWGARRGEALAAGYEWDLVRETPRGVVVVLA
jgi:hypothetical protein